MGELPRGWAWASVGELSRRIDYGYTASASDSPIGPKMLRITDIQDGNVDWGTVPYCDCDDLARFGLNENDIVFARTGATTGKSFRIGELSQPSVFASYLIRLQANREIDTAYLHQWMQSPDYWRQITAERKGSAQPGVNASVLSALRAPIPPLPEQRRIVARIEALLKRANRAREALEAIPPLLDRTRQSLLAAAFRGELTAAWRAGAAATPIAKTLEHTPSPEQPRGGREATDSVITGIAALSVNDPGTPLPEGWAWVPLLRLARQETGHTPSRGKPEYWDGGDIPWIGIKDAGDHHGQIIHDTYQHVTALGLENSSARLLPKGTVCLSRTASVGYVTVMGRDMATSQDFATWTCSSALDPEYLMYALMAEGDEIRRFGKGTTHTTIYFPEIRALHIALAPIEEQSEIVKLCRQALAAIETTACIVAEKRETLATLTQSILAKAFRGELVPQDPTDEPASVLLARIHAERAAQAAAPKKKAGRAAGRPKTQPKEEKGMPKTRKEVPADHLRTIVASRPGQSVKAAELFRLSDMGLDEFYKQLATEMKPGGLRHGADKETLELADAA